MRRKKFLTGAVCAVLWLLTNSGAVAQNFKYQPPVLLNVSFYTHNTNEFILVKSDIDGSGYFGPHYIAAPETKEPVGYVRNSKPRVAARFSLLCNAKKDPPKQILIRGDVDGNQGAYQQRTVNCTAIIEYPATVCSLSLPNEVRYLPEYKIDWKASFDGGSTWLEAGSSVNPLYVTLAFPEAEIPATYDYLWYHTLLHIGCEKGSGATDINTLFAGVWDYVKNRNVTRAHDGAVLQYYGSWTNQNYFTGSLIKNLDGQCLAWTRFLLDILKVQGFQEPENYMFIEPIDSFGIGFYVNSWNFASVGTSGEPDFPFLNKWGSSPPYDIPNGPYNWNEPEVTQGTPLPGQSQNSPKANFENHQFAKILGQYYDPSYGVTYDPQPNGLPNADVALSAFYTAYLWPNNDPPAAHVVRKNPTGVQHKTIIYSY